MNSRPNWRLMPVAFLALLLLSGVCAPQAVRAAEERLVLAFYYPWFDANTWNGGKLSDVPQAPYNSDDPAVMARQIDQARGAGIDALILNWWGTGNRTEKNLRALLDVAAGTGFRIAVVFDLNSPVMGTVASYADNLRHLHAVHAAHPAYLHVQGRPVVFFYNVARLPVATWQSLRDQSDPDRQALWIAEGTDIRYLSVFDGHHLYSVTWPNRISPVQTLPTWGERVRSFARDHGVSKLWVATVMPGYDDRLARPGSGFARSREGGDYYELCWQAALASRPDWVVINSFNEWVEGSAIEPSQAHGSLYLDLTRDASARFKSADLSPAAALPPAPTSRASAPSPTPPPLPKEVELRDLGLFFPAYSGRACGYAQLEGVPDPVWGLTCSSETMAAGSLRPAY